MSKLTLNSFLMSQREMVTAIQRQVQRPRIFSLSLHRIRLDKSLGDELMKLLQLHRHRRWELLELTDCEQTTYLAELLIYVYHAQLFKHVSMKIKSSPPLLRNVRIEPPTGRFHFALQSLALCHYYVSIRNAVRLRKGLESTRQLKMLKLDCIQFERCAIVQICQGIECNTTLQSLDCHWISSVDAYVMMHSVAGHPSISEIHFRGDCISDSGSIFLGKGLNEPTSQLQTLRLTGLGVFDLAPMITEIEANPVIPRSVVPTKITTTTTTTMISCCRLKRLDLSDNLLQNYQIDYLFLQLHKFPTLTDLNLSRNRLSDFCESVLANPTVLSHSLTTLDLTYNRLTDQGADEFLTHLWKFPALRDLNISRNRLQSLNFQSFFRQQPIQTHNLRRLSLFHPHFSLLDPGVAISHHGWRNRAGVSFAERLLWLLQRTPIHLKLGSFWATTSIETQHLIDIRQVSIAEDPASTPAGLWPHMLAQANLLFGNDNTRQANAVFFLLHQGAPCFAASRQNKPPDYLTTSASSSADAVATSKSDGFGAATVSASSSSSSARQPPPNRPLNPTEQEILITGATTKEPGSSEFMTCQSENTDDSVIQNARPGRKRRYKYKRLFRMLRFG